METRVTHYHGQPVTLTPVSGAARRYRVGDTGLEITCGIRFYVLYDGAKVLAIRGSLRGIVARAHAHEAL